MKTIDAEVKMLEDAGTFELVDEADIPASQRALPSHLVFAHKPALVEGKPVRFKARLVVSGNQQSPDTYSSSLLALSDAMPHPC